MTSEELKTLCVGDIVCVKGKSEAFIVTANYGKHAIAVRTVEVSNPGSEWDLVLKASHKTVESK